MSKVNIWESPDGRIRKEILEAGVFGSKPVENSLCELEVTGVQDGEEMAPSEYVSSLEGGTFKVTLGEANTAVDREIDKLLLTMEQGELCNVRLRLPGGARPELRFSARLRGFQSSGYVYQWDAPAKVALALRHKDAATGLFSSGRFVDASHRFSRGLKLLLSVPVPVDTAGQDVDGVPVCDLTSHQTNFYSNLASCNLKMHQYEAVITLCGKVLAREPDHLKALYKRGLAYSGVREFERAEEDLARLLQLQPDNKPARAKLLYVQANLQDQQASYDQIVKRMFR